MCRGVSDGGICGTKADSDAAEVAPLRGSGPARRRYERAAARGRQRGGQFRQGLFYRLRFGAVQGAAAEADLIEGLDNVPRQRGDALGLGRFGQLPARDQGELALRLAGGANQLVLRENVLQPAVEFDLGHATPVGRGRAAAAPASDAAREPTDAAIASPGPAA